MARLFADENFPGPTARRLRELGHDVLTTRDSGLADQGISDRRLLESAGNLGRVFLSLNRRDFIRLHKEGVSHAGIVVCTDDKDFIALADRIHLTIGGLEHLNGQLIRVMRPK